MNPVFSVYEILEHEKKLLAHRPGLFVFGSSNYH
jgi:hypothetical protein